HGQRAGRVGRGQRRGGRAAGGLGHQELAVRRDRAAQRGGRGRRTGGGAVLHAQARQRDRGAGGVLQLDEVVGVRRAGGAAASVDLADHQPGRAGRGRRDGGESGEGGRDEGKAGGGCPAAGRGSGHAASPG